MASSSPISCFPIKASILRKILILVVPVLAFIAGAIAGDRLHADRAESSAPEDAHVSKAATPTEADQPAATGAAAETGGAGHGEAAEAELDWFKFPSQFFVPILRNGTPTAIMVLSLTVEMPSSARPRIEAREHRLRDALLTALLIEANTGGFDGNFTADPAQQRLRAALLTAAQATAGSDVLRILIEDIGKQ
jgi:flagellar FliL protein